MTGSGILIDTNIVIALFGGDAAVKSRFSAAPNVWLSATVIGELYYGARNSGRLAENLRRVEEFAAFSAILSCDGGTAAHYGQIKASLRAKGTPIPENDIWIAATARQHNLTLVSRDAHFNHVDGLDVAAW